MDTVDRITIIGFQYRINLSIVLWTAVDDCGQNGTF